MAIFYDAGRCYAVGVSIGRLNRSRCLLRVKPLQIQEAALTGESMAVEKSIAPVKRESTLGDRPCMAYSGTLVTYGQGAGLVVETGAIQKLARSANRLQKLKMW